MMYFESYKKELEKLYKIKHNKFHLDENDNKKIDAILEEIKKSYKPLKVSISNTTIQEDTSNRKVDFIELYDNCRNSDYVFSLSHGVYKCDESPLLEIWDEQKKRRDDMKVEMKKSLKNNDISKYILYNYYQRVFKENANAIFGACGESNFIFYDLNNISNLTGTCYYVLLTTINQIEKILGNRILLRSKQEMYDYFSYILDKDISSIHEYEEDEYIKLLLDNIKEEDKDYIFKQIEKYITFGLDDKTVVEIKNYIDFVYNDKMRFLVLKYNCNFKKLIDDTDVFSKMIENDFENFTSDKYNEHSFKEKSLLFRKVFECFVYDHFLQTDLLDLVDNYKRSTVMLTDTDSTFCVTPVVFDGIYNSLEGLLQKHNINDLSVLDKKVHSFKMIMFIGETMSDFFLKRLAGPEYQNSKDNRWKLKSEFLYHKILLLKVKKTYFGSILSQEGIRLTPMKLDNKNTEVVRSSYNHITKDFLKEFYNEMVMGEERGLDIYKLIDIIDKYNEVFDKESKNYVSLSKLGTRSDYKLEIAYKNDPITVYQYKAAELFNCLFPEIKHTPGSKTALFPIKEVKTPTFYIESDLSIIDNFDNLDESIKKSITRDLDENNKINALKVMNVLKQKELLHLIDPKKKSKIQKEYKELVKEWYIETYGINEELKTRFTAFFNKSNKSKEEEAVFNSLINDLSINYISTSYYDTMPECLIDIIDTDTIKRNTIEYRTTRIFDALKIKTYNKSIKSKNSKFRTNFIVI